MKIGIVTFHRALNYGALLQVYALQQILKELNIESEIIDYRNSVIEDIYRLKGFGERKTIKEKLKYVLNKKYEVNRRTNFERFRKEKLLLTKKVFRNDGDLKEISDSFDFYITGSDQVWNYNAHGFDGNYFLNFVLNSNKRMSYAASFGISSIPEEHKDKYKSLLQGVTQRSVREVQGVQILKQDFNLSARIDLDPTFLLSKEMWKDRVHLGEKTNKYILLYCFELTKTMKEFIEKLSHATGLEVRSFGETFRNPLGVKNVRIGMSGPVEFVQSFLNAEYIVTNSFHGAAFSINFNKPFFVELLVEGSDVNSRIENIIETVGLKSRYIQNYKAGMPFTEEIDWNVVNEIISNKRKESISYLRETLTLN
ncbi:polysaccharide pyruvyl transferase family protein [Cohnella sp. 56]|uniref:polysaccharide pyruvyl transferase family protein n=1 Tax=Cohnella sp. 56 TaxID=3113722 RepID=UPI0030E8B6CC